MPDILLPNGGGKNNEGEFDYKARTTQEAINATSTSRALYAVGQRFYDTDRGGWFECTGSPATAWGFTPLKSGKISLTGVIEGSYVSNGGSIIDNPALAMSLSYKIKEGDSIYLTGRFNTGTYSVYSFWNSKGVMIYNFVPSGTTNFNKEEVVAPAEAVYFIISNFLSDIYDTDIEVVTEQILQDYNLYDSGLTDITSYFPIIEDSQLTDTGFTENASYEILDYVKVPKGKLYLSGYVNSGAYKLIQYYNYAKIIISSVAPPSTTTYNKEEFTPPADAVFMRFTRLNSGANLLRIEVEDDASMKYINDADADLSGIDSIFKYTVEWTEGYYQDAGGVLKTNSAWAVSQFIQVGEWYKVKGKMLAGAVVSHVCYFDEDEVFVEGSEINTPYDEKLEKITAPENAKYVRFAALITETVSFEYYRPISEAAQGMLLQDVSRYIPFDNEGFISTSTGNVIYNAFWKYAYFLRINPTSSYHISGTFNLGGYAVVAYYDKDKAFIGHRPATGSNDVVVQELLVIPEGTVYMMFTIASTETDTFRLYTDNIASSVISHVCEDVPVDNTTYEGIVMSKYIDMVEGRECNIYLDTLTNVLPLDLNANILYSNPSPFVRKSRNLSLTPAIGQADFNVAFEYTDNKAEVISSKTVTFRTHAKDTGAAQAVNIMCAGDSLTDNYDMAREVFRLLNEDGDYTINQIGTQGSAGGYHEGRGSWRWSDYIADTDYAGATNAFWIGGKLDFQQYCTDNGFSGIDYMLINLGTNDVGQGATITTSTTIATIIANAKIFIDAVLLDFPNCKIAIAIPAIGAPVFTPYDALVFRRSIMDLAKAYIDNFDDGIYSDKVTTFQLGAWIDRENSYPYVVDAISARITETDKRWTNSVHPLQVGYYQWADAYYAKIRAWLTGLL